MYQGKKLLSPPLDFPPLSITLSASGCTRTVSDSENVSTAAEKRPDVTRGGTRGQVGAVISVIMQISVFRGCCLIYKLDETTWLFRARTLLPPLRLGRDTIVVHGNICYTHLEISRISIFSRRPNCWNRKINPSTISTFFCVILPTRLL